MLIKDMFLKSIERDIKGVIKVGQADEENIYQELEEYVVTRELNRHFAKFYENYGKAIDGKTDKMGVWISGFFGSGKSHFLKILAYLLENKRVKNKQAVEFFENKIQDPMLLSNMKRIGNVPTEVILFNIDSKSPLDNKSKEDAILRVFLKVFYEHQGFYGDAPGIAEMERYLTKEGVYEDFKREFKALSGEDWVDRRITFYFDADYVIGALTKVTNMSEESARHWFEHGVNNVEISIEKFANDVKEYIEQKGKNTQLVFLVDEIGQYIGDSRQLMLNLQTLAEDLGTKCQGRVWIMVTSQESIDSIVKVKGDDFSRIQGRFDTRLSLSSISVDEVIKKRILLKKDHAVDKLKLIYHDKSAVLKNLISFKEHTADLQGYADAQEFADVYPFVPYQFKLLQYVFEQVRRHGSSGKHLSEGERSMLSAFKEAGLRYKDAEEGVLVPFHAFYDTIREFLNSSITRVIEGAAENPALKDDPFNIDLLKVLFMIKYIKELPANIENIATLMLQHIDEDKLALKEKIQVSLRKLITQTLIQKHGDIYMFLTDDEQDINRDIKGVKIDDEVIKRELAQYIFQDLYDDKRYKYSAHYMFPYNQKMDDKNYGNQTSSIGIHILSPLSEDYEKSDQELMMQSSGSDMYLKLGGNGDYIEEMEEALKIEEYLKKDITRLPDAIQSILITKRAEAQERRRRVRNGLEEAIKNGEFYVNGNKIDVKGSSVKERINAAFKTLVENVYTKLGYMKSFLSDERDLSNLLKLDARQIKLDGSVEDLNAMAVQEVNQYITLENDMKRQVRVKMLLDRFSNPPYGWHSLDIGGVIAQLVKDQKIRIRYNAEYLEIDDPNFIQVLTKVNEADKAIVIKRTKVDESLLRTAKQICREIFNEPDVKDDEDGLIRDIKHLIAKQVQEIQGYIQRYEGRKYPGKSLLEKGLEYFNQLHNGLDNVTYFSKLRDLHEDLLDWDEDISYVKSFFENQKDIFDKGLVAVAKYDENQLYITSDDAVKIVNRLNEILSDPLPYGKIKEIPELVNKLDEIISKVLEDKKANAITKIQLDYDYLSLRSNEYGVSAETKYKIQQFYDQVFTNINTYKDMYKVDAAISQSANFKERMDGEIIREIDSWKNRNSNDGIEEREEEQYAISPRKEQVKIKDLLIVKTLTTEEDVDKLINTISSKLKQIIQNDKQIELIE